MVAILGVIVAKLMYKKLQEFYGGDPLIAKALKSNDPKEKAELLEKAIAAFHKT